MPTYEITISDEIADDIARRIGKGLDDFNALHNGPDPTRPLWLICQDEAGHVRGGLQAFVQWDWFVISMLWVREEDRGRGIGAELLIQAEQAARDRGCKRARLATMTFQAPGFYEKFGYVEVCRFPDMPPGHSYIWMSKVFSAD